MSIIKWHSEVKRLSDIKPDPKNPRKIEGKNFEDLKESIDKFGLAEPIVINTDGMIIGGHARYYYMKEKNEEEVDCYVPERTLDKEEVKELLVRLNKNIAGQGDFDMLANDFSVEELLDFGFREHELGFMKETEPMMDVDDLTKTMDSYLEGNIRQIVLYFKADEYATVISRLDALMLKEGVDNHTDIFMKMLDAYEENLS